MTEAYTPFDIDHTDYTLVAAHLEDALAACDVRPRTAGDVLAAVKDLRDTIVAS